MGNAFLITKTHMYCFSNRVWYIRSAKMHFILNYKCYDLETKLKFGKYIDKTISEVIKINPKYVKWLINKSDLIISGRIKLALKNK